MNKFKISSLCFFIGGFILPILIMIAAKFIFDEPVRISKINDLAIILGLVCEVFAIFFGVLSWKDSVSKFIVVTVTILIVGLFAVLLVKPGGNTHPVMQDPQIATPSTTK